MFENYEPNQYYKDTETTLCQSENVDEYGIDYTEKVVIGLEQGTTFPTKVGTVVLCCCCEMMTPGST